MMTADIEWEDPPQSLHNTAVPATRWTLFVEELKAHPGKWAVVKRGIQPNRSGGTLQSRLKQRGCEATHRIQPDGTYVLYARWPEGAS